MNMHHHMSCSATKPATKGNRTTKGKPSRIPSASPTGHDAAPPKAAKAKKPPKNEKGTDKRKRVAGELGWPLTEDVAKAQSTRQLRSCWYYGTGSHLPPKVGMDELVELCVTAQLRPEPVTEAPEEQPKATPKATPKAKRPTSGITKAKAAAGLRGMGKRAENLAKDCYAMAHRLSN